MKLRTIVMNILLCLAMVSPALADSRSLTVRASCSIAPLAELAFSPELQVSQTRSSLDARYQMTEEVRDLAGNKIKLYSLTLL